MHKMLKPSSDRSKRVVVVMWKHWKPRYTKKTNSNSIQTRLQFEFSIQQTHMLSTLKNT